MTLSLSNGLRSVLIALVFFSGTTAISQTTWNPTAGGSWNNIANWSSGIPTAATTANFGGTTAQAITLDVATASAAGLNFSTATGAGAFTFNAGTPTGAFSIGASGITTSTANVTINPAVALAANQTWSTNGTGTITVGGVISGGFGIIKAGTGTLILSGTNTFSGAKTVTAGVLRGTVAGAFGGSGALNLNGGSLELSVDAATTFTNTNTVIGGNATVISNRATAGAGVTHTLGTLSIGAFTLTTTRGTNSTSGTGGVTFGATTLTGSATFAPGANSQLNLGAVSGAFALNAGGSGSAGTTVLTAASTYSGGTNLLTGTGTGILQVNNNASLGTGAVTITTATATRLSVSGGVTITNAINFPASGSIAGVSGFGLLSQNGTGQATITSNLVINSTTTAGGHFQGGTAVGNELVLTGAISGTATTINNRIGRVIFSNATSAYSGTILTSGTLLPGLTNGIPTAASLNIGTSGNASLNLNGFNQTVASITMGDSNGNNAAIVLGANTLTMNGNLSSATLTTQTQAHTVTASPGGTINFGSVARDISLTDNLATEDLTMTGVSLATSASINKTGSGSLILRNSSVLGQFNVNQGMIAASSLTNTGTATFTALGFTGTATTIRMNIAASGGDVINGGIVTASGTNTFALSEWGGQLAVGTYPLIGYTGTSPGLSAFSTGTLPGRVVGTLTDTGTAIALNVTGNDTVTWTGTIDSNWNTTTNNWVTTTGGVATSFQTGDYLIFPDSGTNTTITTAAATTFNPGQVTFTNTTANSYTIQPNITIAGLTTNFVKTGNGTVTLNNPNTFAGSTTISDGTLILNATTGSLTATSGISVAAPATFRVIAVDTGTTAGNLTISRSISGLGTLEFNPRFSGSTNPTSMNISLTGTNSGFNGTLRLLAPVSGTYRIQANLTQIGNGPIEVQNGAQFYTATGGLTFNNPISIRGTGYAEAGTSGNIGALRLENGSVWAGPVTIDAAGARLGAHNATATISGNISGGPAEFNATNFNNSYTVILTGTNSYSTTVIGGQNTQTAGVPSMRLNIGNGGTTGTLGTGSVTINGDGANGILGFDRSNGYTLGVGQTITGAGSSITRTFIDLDTTGSTFSDGGNNITLGAAGPAAGGNIRIGQSRANAIATVSSTWTTETLRVSSGQNNATLNIGSGAQINANFFSVGEAAGMSGVVNQTAGAVNVTGQLRLGHFGTNTSVYNMSGGTVTMTGASQANSPSQAAGGGASTVGDNNLSGAATASIIGGGIYLGIDGTGIFNQSNGTVTTNWIVLDNRSDTSFGTNMPTGVDAYNLTGGTLNFRSNWGLIGRNATHQVTFGGGTVRADNTGSGTGTGANITIPLDAFIQSTASTTTTLDTNGAGNGFSFLRDVTGTGTFTFTGGGTINFSTTGTQMISPVINTSGTGATIAKLGTGTTTLANTMSGFTGNIQVSAGQLNVPNDLGAGNITVNDGATLSGEPLLVSTLTLGSTAGGANLVFNPATTGMITASTLTTVGGTPANLIFSSSPSTGLYPVIQYTTFAGTSANFTVPGVYRAPPTVINDTATSQIQVNFTAGANLVWTGAASNAWNINSALNWNNLTTSTNPDVFYSLDSVTFPDGPSNTALTLTGSLNPSAMTFSNTTATSYTVTSTAGNQIVGGTGLSKTGNGTVTLNGPNTFSGVVNLAGGTLAFNDPNSLGNGSLTNTITLSTGSRLSYFGSTALDLGVNRTINLLAAGNSISHNNATAAAITISGNLTGSGALSFHTNAAGNGTFILRGNNSGYTGEISVDSSATSTGLTTLRFDSQLAIPSSGTIVVNYPAGATTSGNANTLNLQGNLTIPVNLPITLNSFLTGGNVSQRTQITVPTGATATINAPMILSGTTIIQLAGGGNMVLNGNITGPGFSNVFFTRGTGATFTVNGTVTLPSTATFGLTDSPVTTINSTGNTWGITTVLSGAILRLGANNALAVSASLNIGQSSDSANSTFDMNGFSQVVNGLTWAAGTANSTRGIINNSTTLSTLTISSTTDATYGSATGFTGGLINGNIALVKTGSSNQTLGGLNNFTGNVTVNNGTLTANAVGSNTTGALGHNSTSGRTVTVASGASLSFTSNNIFGNSIGNANLPAVTVAGTLTSTRYNVIGDLTLNGGTLTQSSTDSGGYEGFQFRGNVTVGGTAVSTISTSASKANHLNANTIFNVADATSSTAVDLLVSAPLRNQSTDFASAVGSLTKTGAGTMQLTAANSYTGGSTVTAGILSGTVASAFGTGAITLNGGTLDLSNDNATTFGNNTVISANSSINANRATSGAAVTHTLGTLSIGAQTLTTTPGANVSSGTAGVTFGNTTLTGNATFAPAANTLVSLGIVTGTGFSLTQNGTGTTQLTLANTYTGNTNIVTGTLAMTGNASLASSPVITVGTTPGNGSLNVSGVTGGTQLTGGNFTLASGQTLAGHGTVAGGTNGLAIPTGSTLSPGTSAGTLTINANAIVGGAYLWELATAGASSATPPANGISSPALPHLNHDMVVINGTANVNGMTINLVSLSATGFDNTQYYSWQILTTTGSLTGTPVLGSLTGTDFSSFGGFMSVMTDTNSVYVNYSPVPEPTLMFAIAGLVGVGGFIRNRQGKRAVS